MIREKSNSNIQEKSQGIKENTLFVLIWVNHRPRHLSYFPKISKHKT